MIKIIYSVVFIASFSTNIVLHAYTPHGVVGGDSTVVKGSQQTSPATPATGSLLTPLPSVDTGQAGAESSMVASVLDDKFSLPVMHGYRETDQNSAQQSAVPLMPLPRDRHRFSYDQSGNGGNADAVYGESGSRASATPIMKRGAVAPTGAASVDRSFAASDEADTVTAGKSHTPVTYSNPSPYANQGSEHSGTRIQCPDSLYMGGNSYAVSMLKKAGCPKPENYEGPWY